MSAAHESFLKATLEPQGHPAWVLYTARATPPRAGDGQGLWEQEECTDVATAGNALAACAAHGDAYAALAWFAPGQGRTKAAVVGKRTVTVDLDAKPLPGTTPEARMQAAQTLARSLPCPSVIVNSGGGFHVHVLLPEHERVEAFADPADGVAHVELLGRALRLWFEDKARQVHGAAVEFDHCHGAERVWRIPPGWNTKSAGDARGLTDDRSRWREVRLEVPARIEGLGSIAPADLTFLVPFINAAAAEAGAAACGPHAPPAATPATSPGQTLDSGATSVAGPGQFDPASVELVLPKPLRDEWPMRGGDQSRHDWAICAALARNGWAPSVAAGVVRLRRGLLASAEDRAKGDRLDYVARTVHGAYAQHAPQQGERRLLEPQPFPGGVLPEQLAEFILRASAALRCAPEAIALPHLTALGSAIGNSRRIRLKRTWTEPPLLWSAVIQRSGQLKSPALDQGIRGVDEAQAAAMRAYRAAMQEYKRQLDEHRRQPKSKAGDEALAALRPGAPERPVLQRVKVSDTTIEAVAMILEENPRGVMLVRDELAGWFKSFDAYRQGRGSDREHWLTAHRAGQMLVDRKVDRQVVLVPHGFIAVTGGIQPNTLRRLFTDPLFECGMAARLLLSQPTAPKRRWSDDDIPPYVERAVSVVFQRLFGLEMDRNAQGDVSPMCMDLSADAKPAWVSFYDEFAGEQERLDGEEELGAAFSKLEAYAARIALILELVAWAASGGKGTPTTVGRAALEAAIVLTRWFAGEARRIYADMGRGGSTPLRGRAWEWLKKQSGAVTARDLMRGSRPFRDSSDVCVRALDDLVHAGLAWKLPGSRQRNGGWRVICYVPREGARIDSEAPSEAQKQATSTGAGDAEPPATGGMEEAHG
jgi:hypothetical protein